MGWEAEDAEVAWAEVLAEMTPSEFIRYEQGKMTEEEFDQIGQRQDEPMEVRDGLGA